MDLIKGLMAEEIGGKEVKGLSSMFNQVLSSKEDTKAVIKAVIKAGIRELTKGDTNNTSKVVISSITKVATPISRDSKVKDINRGLGIRDHHSTPTIAMQVVLPTDMVLWTIIRGAVISVMEAGTTTEGEDKIKTIAQTNAKESGEQQQETPICTKN